MGYDIHVKKAFFRFVVSCILASLGTALGTFVDAVIVGNAIGSDALAVINIAMPVYMFYNTIGFTIGMGASVFISRHIGNMEPKQAKSAFTTAILTGLVFSVIITALGGLFSESIITALGASGEIMPLAKDYIGSLLFAAPLFILTPIVIMSIRSDANPFVAMIAVNAFAAINLILDLVFIYVFHWGILGAALAIIAGQLTALLIGLSHFRRKDACISFQMGSEVTVKSAGKLLAAGVGYGLTYFFQMLIIVLLNNILSIRFGVEQIAVYSVMFSISMLAYVFFDGVSMAISPLVATYYGEKNKKSINMTMKLAFKFLLVTSTLLAAVILLFAEPLTVLFGIRDPAVVGISVQVLRVYTGAILFTSLNYAMIVYLQAIERDRLATIISVLRGFVLLAPVSAILTYHLGAVGISFAFIVVEGIITFAIAALLLIISKKRGCSFLLLSKTESPLPTYETMIDSGFNNLESVVDEIQIFCEEAEINMSKSYFVNLVIEELVVKIFEEGFKSNHKKTNYINIRIVKDGDAVNIHIRDDATGYNPFKTGNTSDDALDIMGIEMVKTKAQYFNYQRKLVFNNLYVIL